MRKKTKAEKELKKIESKESSLEAKKDQAESERLLIVNSLANSGEMAYQILIKWAETNQLLKEQNELLKERNKILLEEELEDSDEEDEDYDDSDEEE